MPKLDWDIKFFILVILGVLILSAVEELIWLSRIGMLSRASPGPVVEGEFRKVPETEAEAEAKAKAQAEIYI